MDIERTLRLLTEEALALATLHQMDFDLRQAQFIRDMARQGIRVTWHIPNFLFGTQSGYTADFRDVYGFYDIIEKCFHELSRFVTTTPTEDY